MENGRSSGYPSWLGGTIIPARSQIEGLGMRRRDFITVLAGAAGYPHLAGAQQKAMPVIAFLSSGAARPRAPLLAAFHVRG